MKDLMIMSAIFILLFITTISVITFNSSQEIKSTSPLCEYKYTTNDLTDSTCDYTLIEQNIKSIKAGQNPIY